MVASLRRRPARRAAKGKDSVNNGIQLVQAQPISVTSRSLNVIKEYRNYLWIMTATARSRTFPIMNTATQWTRYAMRSFRFTNRFHQYRDQQPVLSNRIREWRHRLVDHRYPECRHSCPFKRAFGIGEIVVSGLGWHIRL
jgi:hypothetical protein